MRVGRLAEAAGLLRRALAIAPGYRDASNNLARVEAHLGGGDRGGER